jgi:hypothetical protein
MAELSGLSARAAAEELNRRGIAATAEGGNAQKSSHPSARAASMKDGKATLVRCPICKAEAEEIDRGLFEGTAFDCKFHGRFRVSGTFLAQQKKRTRRQWEHALMLAKARASDALPLISSELL